jgi:hypothetical protein
MKESFGTVLGVVVGSLLLLGGIVDEPSWEPVRTW